MDDEQWYSDFISEHKDFPVTMYIDALELVVMKVSVDMALDVMTHDDPEDKPIPLNIKNEVIGVLERLAANCQRKMNETDTKICRASCTGPDDELPRDATEEEIKNRIVHLVKDKAVQIKFKTPFYMNDFNRSLESLARIEEERKGR